LGQWRGWGWMGSLGLICFVGTAAGGLWLGLAVGWMFLGAFAALVAWDLHDFVQRLRSVGWVETQAARHRELEQRHLRRLLIVQVLGALLAVIALGFKVDNPYFLSVISTPSANGAPQRAQKASSG